MLMEGPTSAKLRKAQLSACPNTSALLTCVEVRMTYSENRPLPDRFGLSSATRAGQPAT